jgi:hypothetical protein
VNRPRCHALGARRILGDDGLEHHEGEARDTIGVQLLFIQ